MVYIPEGYRTKRIAEILGYGPIETLLHDGTITEIMVNGPGAIYIEREGAHHLTFGGGKHRLIDSAQDAEGADDLAMPVVPRLGHGRTELGRQRGLRRFREVTQRVAQRQLALSVPVLWRAQLARGAVPAIRTSSPVCCSQRGAHCSDRLSFVTSRATPSRSVPVASAGGWFCRRPKSSAMTFLMAALMSPLPKLAVAIDQSSSSAIVWLEVS